MELSSGVAVQPSALLSSPSSNEGLKTISGLSLHDAASCSGVAVLPARRYAERAFMAEASAGLAMVDVLYVGKGGGAVPVGGEVGAVPQLKIGWRDELVHVAATTAVCGRTEVTRIVWTTVS